MHYFLFYKKTTVKASLIEEEQSAGKKKTPMCLINELARHYKVIVDLSTGLTETVLMTSVYFSFSHSIV